MAIKSTFQKFHSFYKGALIFKYTDQSDNTYYYAKTAEGNKFLCTGKTLEEIKQNIEKQMTKYKATNFEPVAGYTVTAAVTDAVKQARQNNTLVITKINDVLLFITKKADVDKFVSLYQKKLNMKYKQKTR